MENFEPKDFNFSINGELAHIIISSLVEIFEQNGGKNYLTLTFLDSNGKKYAVTIQDCSQRKTPHEEITTLNEKVKKLRQSNEIKDEIITELYRRINNAERAIDELYKHIFSLNLIEHQLEKLSEQRENVISKILNSIPSLPSINYLFESLNQNPPPNYPFDQK